MKFIVQNKFGEIKIAEEENGDNYLLVKMRDSQKSDLNQNKTGSGNTGQKLSYKLNNNIENNVTNEKYKKNVGSLAFKGKVSVFEENIEKLLNGNDKEHNKNSLNCSNDACKSSKNLDIAGSSIIDKNLEIIQHTPSFEEKEQLMTSLKKNFVIQSMKDELFQILISELFYFKIKKNQVLYSQEEEGNFLFILVSGKMISRSYRNTDTKVNSNGKEALEKTIKNWEIFGEVALLKTCVREETIICMTDAYLYGLNCEQFREIQKNINDNELKERYIYINQIPLFATLGNIYKFNLSNKIQSKCFVPNERIIYEGTVGETLYIIKKGIVSCKIGNKQIRRLYEKEYFGQNAILMDIKRGCDVISVTNSICYEISRNDLKEALSENYTEIILSSFFIDCIKKNKFFNEIISESKFEDLFKVFYIKQYKKSNPIFYSYQSNNKNRRVLFIIEGGLFKRTKNNEQSISDFDESDVYAKRGDIIGKELFENSSLTLPKNVFAYPDCIALEALFEDVQKIIGIFNIPQEVSFKSNTFEKLNKEDQLRAIQKVNKLRKVNLFKNLSDNTINEIATFMKKKRYEPGEHIVKEGENGDTFYLILKGQVKVTVNGKMIRYLEAGNYFGEIALLTEGEKRTATITVTDRDVNCYEIKKSEFNEIIKDKVILEHLKYKIALQDTTVELNDLYNIKFLGKGKFGCVSLVHNKKNIYVVKTVSRKSVENLKMLAKYYVNERRIMLLLDHPFIVKLVKTMRNQKYCFFLMEHINGENLDEYLTSNRHKKKNKNETKFYIASLILVLDYLQKKSIAHRDIKPSNIMLSECGYIKVIDFGTAKILNDYTHTVIGTPYYIAPEILQGKGYTLSCDFWSLGVCVYELFYGDYPFGAYANEVMEIYKDILKRDYSVPSNSDYKDINELISDLLQKKPNLRVCNSNFLKKKPFFNNFDWNKLIDFKLKAPYIPHSLDLSNPFSSTEPFESSIKESEFSEIEKSKKIPRDYNKRWADEF